MSAWLLSVVGVTVVGVLVELLLSDSPMSRFVRSIYAFFILFVIVMPLPGFLRGGLTFDLKPISVNTQYIDDINIQRIQNALVGVGINGAKVTIAGDRVTVMVANDAKVDPEVIIQIVMAVAGIDRANVEVIV